MGEKRFLTLAHVHEKEAQRETCERKWRRETQKRENDRSESRSREK